MGPGIDDNHKSIGQTLKAQPKVHAPVRADDLAGGRPSSGGEASANSSAAPGESVVLDALALDRLRELDPTGDNKLIERVVKAFKGSVERLVPQMLEATAARDFAGVRHVAHTLKSSSASIGATRLSRLCAELESLIRLQVLDNIAVQVDGLNAEIKAVVAALDQLLESRA